MNDRDLAEFCHSLSGLTQENRQNLAQFVIHHMLTVLADRQGACQCPTLKEYLQVCTANPGEQRKLYSSCFNSTSEFFRDRWTFSLLERTYLPLLLARGGLRIWCAGCAAGQEALSLAILVEELAPVLAGASATIFATDIGQDQQALAMAGRYPRSQFRHMTLERIERWFLPDGEALQVIDELRSKPLYSTHDLLDKQAFCPPESIFGSFDIISCMNVLLYYNHTTQVRLLQNFHRTLASDGLLVVAPAEIGIVSQSGLFANLCDGAIFKVIPGESCPK